MLATSRIRAESQLEFEIVGRFDGYRVGGQRPLPWPPGEAEHSSGELWRGDQREHASFPAARANEQVEIRSAKS